MARVLGLQTGTWSLGQTQREASDCRVKKANLSCEPTGGLENTACHSIQGRMLVLLWSRCLVKFPYTLRLPFDHILLFTLQLF